jgi:5-methyltetrahydropteroyltriglutamate--homocysteine methyltransferase
MPPHTDKILTTHAGSLPRPRALVALHTARYGGAAVEAAALAQATEEAVRAVIAKQIETGLDLCAAPYERFRRDRHAPNHG